MTPLEALAVVLAGVGAGAVNALAGGGTLISFPVLVALGVPPVSANVTNTVALSPGYLGGAWSQRAQLDGQRERARSLSVVAAAGGLLGSAVLLATSDSVFGALVPVLLFVASALLALQEPLRRRILEHEGAAVDGVGSGSAPTRVTHRMLSGGVFLAAVYGGFFGAGLGIVLLAVLGTLLTDPLPRLNALKQLLAFVVNVTAAAWFVVSGPVDWSVAVVLAVGAVIGGALGGRLAGAVSPSQLRRVVVAIGFVAAAVYAVKEWM